MTELYVKVKTDQNEFNIETGHMLKVSLTEKAENNRANTELIQSLSNILGEKVAIVKGHKSRRKKVKLEASESEVERRIKKWQRHR